jgi:hypothetical protein
MSRANEVLKVISEAQAINEVKITDYAEALRNSKAIGYAAISFRNNERWPKGWSQYALNSTGDGWFRKTDEPGKGYGLCIVDMKVRSKKSEFYGKYLLYKAVMKYIQSDHDGDQEESAPVWIFVSQEFELDDVLKYIKQNSKKWRP